MSEAAAERLAGLLAEGRRRAVFLPRDHRRWVMALTGRDRRLLEDAARALGAVNESGVLAGESLRLLTSRSRVLLAEVVRAVDFWEEILADPSQRRQVSGG